MPPSTAIAVGVIGGGNCSTQKTTDLPQVTYKLYQIKIYQVHQHALKYLLY